MTQHGNREQFRAGCRCDPCQAAVPHGTPTAYVYWTCRCTKCTNTNRRRQQVYKLRKLEGEPIWGDIDEVRRRLLQLRGEGHSWAAIANALGYTNQYRLRLMFQQDRVTATVARRILTVNMHRISPDILIPALGTTRRLRALARAGYPTNLIADIIGFDVATLQRVTRGDQLRVRRWVADAVRTYYDQNSTHPGPSPETTVRAKQLGWHPPLAWDDDDFDDPKGQARARTRIKR